MNVSDGVKKLDFFRGHVSFKGTVQWNTFFSEIKPIYGSPIYQLRRKNRAPIALRGSKWLQNVDLKIFRVLYRTPGIV